MLTSVILALQDSKTTAAALWSAGLFASYALSFEGQPVTSKLFGGISCLARLQGAQARCRMHARRNVLNALPLELDSSFVVEEGGP